MPSVSNFMRSIIFNIQFSIFNNKKYAEREQLHAKHNLQFSIIKSMPSVSNFTAKR